MNWALALAAALLLAAGCGEGAAPKAKGPTEPPAKAEGPTEPPPKVPGVSTAPPPAWVETSSGDHWLAFFSYCWSTTCVDSRPAEQRTDVPRIEVAPGEVVRFHLGFPPTEVTLRIGPKTYPLSSERVTSWRATGSGGLVFLTAKGQPGSAGYVARMLVR